MNINATIIGQMIAFAFFVWFTMKFVWPPFIGAINERQRKIEEGLNAAEKAKADLASAESQVQEEFASAKAQAASIIERANKTGLKASVLLVQPSKRLTSKLHKAANSCVHKLQRLQYLVLKKF